MKQGSSGLTIRDIQVQYQPALELIPKKVSQWVDNLPKANLGDSCKAIYRLLVDANQSIIEPDKRLTILNIIEPESYQLVESLEKQFINDHISLTEKQKKVAALVQAIQTELAIGYHTVIDSLVSQEIKWSGKKLLTQALAFAIYYHGQVIFRCYKLYASVPRRLWRELYCLFQIARQHELEDKSLDLTSRIKNTSVQQEFTQIVLLSVANPYQLRQREITLLWDTLPQICDHVSLKTHAYNTQHYVIALDSSSPPIHKSLFKQVSKAQSLKLTTFTAIEQIKEMLAHVKNNDQQGTRQIMLFRHIINCWSANAHRSFARTTCEGKLDISIGLAATHFLLIENAQANNDTQTSDTLERMEGSLKNVTIHEVSVKQREELKRTYDYMSSSGAPNADVWSKLYQTEKERQQQARQAQSITKTRDTIVRENYKYQQVELLNMSPNGYCIQIPSEQIPNHAQTGEILAFREPGASQQWSIGVVRWVRRQLKDSIIQMGVQLLAPGVTPVNIHLRNSKSDTNKIQRGLLLPELTGIGQPATLITNPLSFNLHSKVRLTLTGQTMDIRLNKELSATSNYKQFSFDLITPTESPDKKSGSTPEPPDFDNMWDIL